MKEASEARSIEMDPTFYMFKPERVDDFRRPDFDDLNFYDKEVLHREWFIFVYKILPLVNEDWGRVLKDNHIKDKPNIYDYTYLSDEVLACWVIKNK